MKTTIETITPKIAQAMLEKHLTPFLAKNPNCQRVFSQKVAEGYARAMRAGQWGLTHQGVAIDDTGFLIDGQHRLAAIVQSGVTIKLQVTRDVPSNGAGCAGGIHVIDMVDRGVMRGVGQQLQMRHGVLDANYVAAICRNIIMLAADSAGLKIGKTDVGMCLCVLDIYKNEIRVIHEQKPKVAGLRTAPLAAALVFAIKVGNSSKIIAFAEKIKTGEDLHKGEPALTLRNYLLSNYTDLGGGNRCYKYITRATLTAVMNHELSENMKQVKISDVGYTYYMERQRKTITNLLDRCGFVLR